MLVSPASADFNCSANDVGLELPLGNARTKRASCGCVKVGEKWILAMPEEISSCAKLRSPAADPNGTPSNKIWVPDAPSSTPLPPLSSSALRNSFHVVSNCAAVRTCPNSYRRANFSRMLRLRTKARAEARVSVAIKLPRRAATSRGSPGILTTVWRPCGRDKLRMRYCTHFNNIFRRISVRPLLHRISTLNPRDRRWLLLLFDGSTITCAKKCR